MSELLMKILLKLDIFGFFKYITEGDDTKRVRVLSALVFAGQTMAIGILIYIIVLMIADKKIEIREINQENARLRIEDQNECNREKIEIEGRAAIFRTQFFREFQELRKDYKELLKTKNK